MKYNVIIQQQRQRHQQQASKRKRFTMMMNIIILSLLLVLSVAYQVDAVPEKKRKRNYLKKEDDVSQHRRLTEQHRLQNQQSQPKLKPLKRRTLSKYIHLQNENTTNNLRTIKEEEERVLQDQRNRQRLRKKTGQRGKKKKTKGVKGGGKGKSSKSHESSSSSYDVGTVLNEDNPNDILVVEVMEDVEDDSEEDIEDDLERDHAGNALLDIIDEVKGVTNSAAITKPTNYKEHAVNAVGGKLVFGDKEEETPEKSPENAATPRIRPLFHDCILSTPERPANLACPSRSLAATCDKYNSALNPDGSRVAMFEDCYEMCKPSFCCIHDSKSVEYSPSCSSEPNCPLYFPCYIIWWKLHDTIGPANFLRVSQREPFYETVDFNYILTDLNLDIPFFQQLFGHHFDQEIDGDGNEPTNELLEDPANW